VENPLATDQAAFVEGVCLAGDLPLAAALFRVRTRQVLDGQSPQSNRAFLSGLVIGGELAYLRDQAAASAPLVLCAAAGLSAPYAAACAALGLGPRLVVVPPDDVPMLSASAQLLVLRRLRVL
jgi:2-dehydro-3-deoxygalactonokinase